MSSTINKIPTIYLFFNCVHQSVINHANVCETHLLKPYV